VKGKPEEIAKFRRLVDVFERESVNESALVMLGVVAMMIDGLQIFHGLPPEETVRAAREHLQRMGREEPPS
jgi:hypothetical protein